jgi:hypothetical protein
MVLMELWHLLLKPSHISRTRRVHDNHSSTKMALSTDITLTAHTAVEAFLFFIALTLCIIDLIKVRRRRDPLRRGIIWLHATFVLATMYVQTQVIRKRET